MWLGQIAGRARVGRIIASERDVNFDVSSSAQVSLQPQASGPFPHGEYCSDATSSRTRRTVRALPQVYGTLALRHTGSDRAVFVADLILSLRELLSREQRNWPGRLHVGSSGLGGQPVTHLSTHSWALGNPTRPALYREVNAASKSKLGMEGRCFMEGELDTRESSSSCIEVATLRQPVDAVVSVSGSKSFTNRALLVAALAEGRSSLTRALFSDDTTYMSQSLRELGAKIVADDTRNVFEVLGNGGRIPVDGANLYIGNSGTSARFLMSYVALGGGEFLIDGDSPMRRSRPVAPLVNALDSLGIHISYQKLEGHLPIVVHADGFRGGKVELDAGRSSQFLTSLMLIAPYTDRGLEIVMTGPYKTEYIDITLSVMREFGVDVVNDEYQQFWIPGGQSYKARDYSIEPDASSASYFFAAAALTRGRVQVTGIPLDSAQGDVRFVDVLEEMGCQVSSARAGIEVRGPESLEGIVIDMKAISDTFPTLAALGPFCRRPVSIRNIEHTRWQETDRIHAMVAELRRLGVLVEEHRDGLTISPSNDFTPTAVETYGDHRIAMSLALIGLRVPGVWIRDPGCVHKTFPMFFALLDKLSGQGGAA